MSSLSILLIMLRVIPRDFCCLTVEPKLEESEPRDVFPTEKKDSNNLIQKCKLAAYAQEDEHFYIEKKNKVEEKPESAEKKDRNPEKIETNAMEIETDAEEKENNLEEEKEKNPEEKEEPSMEMEANAGEKAKNEEEEENPSLNKLDDDSLYLIFDYLAEDTKYILLLGTVCRRWCNLLYTCRYLKNVPFINDFTGLTNALPFHNIQSAIVKPRPFAEKLSLDMAERSIFRFTPTLTHLNASFSPSKEMIAHLRHKVFLSSLYLSDFQYYRPVLHGWKEFWVANVHLRHLKIENWMHPYDFRTLPEGLESFTAQVVTSDWFGNYERLTYLEIGCLDKMNFNLPALETLKLRLCRSLPSRAPPRLKHFSCGLKPTTHDVCRYDVPENAQDFVASACHTLKDLYFPALELDRDCVFERLTNLLIKGIKRTTTKSAIHFPVLEFFSVSFSHGDALPTEASSTLRSVEIRMDYRDTESQTATVGQFLKGLSRLRKLYLRTYDPRVLDLRKIVADDIPRDHLTHLTLRGALSGDVYLCMFPRLTFFEKRFSISDEWQSDRPINNFVVLPTKLDTLIVDHDMRMESVFGEFHVRELHIHQPPLKRLTKVLTQCVRHVRILHISYSVVYENLIDDVLQVFQNCENNELFALYVEPQFMCYEKKFRQACKHLQIFRMIS